MPNLLILDANQRSALAATRSLGKRGIPIITGDETPKTLAGASRYCKKAIVYPSPYQEPRRFIETILKKIAEHEIKVIFPMTDVTTYLILRYKNEFSDITIPFAEFESFELLTDKWKLFNLAEKIDIPIPQTYFIKDISKIDNIRSKLSFPLVIKPYRSRIFSTGKWISTVVRYASSLMELKKTIETDDIYQQYPFLLQEYINGTGQGIFVLYNKGNPAAFFAHKRLREKPPSGGVSVLCESVEVNPRMRQIAQKIMNKVHWHGIAMVEFRVSSDGIPYLMEVNARFWGSLQLAIDAGVDFPWLLYQLAVEKKVNKLDNYKIGIKMRWLLGDLDHLYMRLFKDEINHYLSYTEKLSAIIQFLNFFNRNTRYEINRWDDLKPFLFELKQYLIRLKR